MSGLRRTSYTSQKRGRLAPKFEERSTLDYIYLSLLELSSPSSERCSDGAQAQFNPGCTPPLMKDLLKILLFKPISLVLLIALFLSVGIALRLAGPISIRTHRVELPDVEIHIGEAEGLKSSPQKTTTPVPHQRRHRAGTR